jgi:competence protein ComEC
MLLLCVFAPQKSLAPGRVEVMQLDVGQGLAILLRTKGHSLLYDAGPRVGDVDIGERVVLPAIRRAAVRQLDMMLLSHAHLDHIGGAQAIARALPVTRVLAGDHQRMPRSLRGDACRDGETWTWDEVTFTTWVWSQAKESNPASCVLRVEANGERLLLTGDIDVHAERAMLAQGFDVRADWLQSPHHGSRSSSSQVFLRAVAPRAVLISRGRNNTFGHPHPLVMARYQRLGMQIHDSAELGAITLQLGEFGDARAERRTRHFWRE